MDGLDRAVELMNRAAMERLGASRLEVLSARDVCRLPEPPGEDELLGQLLRRRQRVILGGHTGEGKTTFGNQMLRAHTAAEPFLEWNGAGGRALVIDGEQGLRTVKRRLKEARLETSTAVDYLRVPDGLTLDKNPTEVGEIERILAQGSYDVVLAGPLYKLHGGDSNAEREAVDLMKVFDRWREGYGFGLILEVHCRKPPTGARFTMHEFFGSSAYLRGAEVVVGLEKLRPGYSRLHFFKDRDGDLPVGMAWGLLFDRDQGFRRDPSDGKPKETASEKVRQVLESELHATSEQLEGTTGYSERTVRDALRKLDAKHKTVAGGRRLWSLPGGDRQ
jgi:hypothetical protein